MRHLLILTFILSVSTHSIGQYEFTDVNNIECTQIKSQDRTGTCWSFATSSFLESELIRQGYNNPNLSEMFAVRNIYRDKAYNYIYRQGKANFSQGSLSHDVMRAFKMYGAVPEAAYPGRSSAEDPHNHSEMERALKGLLDGVRKGKSLSPKWKDAVDAVLDVYLGPAPDKFMEGGVTHTAESYAKSLKINPDDYVSLSSFTHHPFYTQFILEIPDNYSNGYFYNVPIAELMGIMDNALDKGYSIAWDGDVSEKGFNAREGIAVLPTDASREDLFTQPGEEVKVTQTIRQENFESLSTTDDHLMHVVGSAKDQDGNLYYIIKNSWGEISPYKGYLYMSRPYAEMKTMAIFVHKDAIPRPIRKKLGL